MLQANAERSGRNLKKFQNTKKRLTRQRVSLEVECMLPRASGKPML